MYGGDYVVVFSTTKLKAIEAYGLLFSYWEKYR